MYVVSKGQTERSSSPNGDGPGRGLSAELLHLDVGVGGMPDGRKVAATFAHHL